MSERDRQPAPELTPRLAAVLAGGALGSLLRAAQLAGLANDAAGAFPWGTLSVNLVGSFALGAFLRAWLDSAARQPAWRGFFAVGLCASYTSLSALAADLAARGWSPSSAVYALASLAGGLLAVQAGSAMTRRREGTRGRALLAFAVLSPALAALAALLAGGAPRPAAADLALTAAQIAAGGAAGAGARWGVSAWLAARRRPLPWGTFAANVSGCLLAGLLAGALAGGAHVPEWLELLLVTGAVGALTTFSTLAWDVHAALAAGARRAAVVNLGATLVGALAAFELGRRLAG